MSDTIAPSSSEPEGGLQDTVSAVLGLLVRRRWWILGTACGIALATIAALWMLPNHYKSEATLVVVQQQVPERYVVPNSTTDISAALEAMKREILSRNQLLPIINTFGLYRSAGHANAEQVIALMLRDIDIQPLDEQASRRDFNAFRISFVADNPALAQQVTGTLTSLFIDENLRTREQQATNTTRFLHEQVLSKARRLEEQEQRLRDFKLRHLGELPEQQQGNLGILTGLQSQLQNTMASLSRAQEQHVYLESLLNGYLRQTPLTADNSRPASPAQVLTPLQTVQNDLARLTATRATLLSKYTPEHPDILNVEREISRTQAVLRSMEASDAAPARFEVSDIAQRDSRASDDPALQPAIAQIRSQLDANRLEIDNLSKDEHQLKASVAQYQTRLNQTPIRQQEESGIVRDTEALRQEYAELQKKEQESQLATNLERQQGGQQFRLVDPASLPALPSSPKRLKLSFFGIGGGLALGLALALLLDQLRAAYHSEDQVRRRLGAPLVVGVPRMLTPGEQRWRFWRSGLEAIGAFVLLAAVSVAEFCVYKFG